MRKSVLLVLSLFAIIATCSHAFAQATTTYTQQGVTTGTATTPLRVFDVEFDQGATVDWMETSINPGYLVSCGQLGSNPSTGLGFVMGTIPALSADQKCWNVSSVAGNSVTFSGTADDGAAFDSVFTFSYSTVRKCGGSGRGGTCKTVYTLSNGVLVVTKH